MKNKTLQQRKKVSTGALLGIPYALFLFIFVVLPFLILFYYAFSTTKIIDGFSKTVFSFSNFKVIPWTVIARSFGIGIISTFICLLISYPTAYFLSSKEYCKSKVLIFLFVFPMVLNFLLKILATKAMFVFMDIKLGYGAVIIATVAMFLPFMILPIYNTMTKIDPSLLEASVDLGATRFQTLRKIIFPLSVPGIISGITMVLIPSITAYIIPDIMSNKTIDLVGNYIDQNIRYHFLGPASAISIILLLFILLSMLVSKLVEKKYNEQENFTL